MFTWSLGALIVLGYLDPLGLLQAGQAVGGRVRTGDVHGRPYDLGATWAHGRSAEDRALGAVGSSADLAKTCIHTYRYIYGYTYIYIYENMYIYIYIYIYMKKYVCIYIYVSI